MVSLPDLTLGQNYILKILPQEEALRRLQRAGADARGAGGHEEGVRAGAALPHHGAPRLAARLRAHGQVGCDWLPAVAILSCDWLPAVTILSCH